VTKEGRFDEVGRDGRAVERKKGQCGTGTQLVQRGGNSFLAAAGFAFDERRKRRRRIEIDLTAQLAHRQAVADQEAAVFVFARGCFDGAPEERAQVVRLAGLGHQIDRAQGARPLCVRLLVLTRQDQNADVRDVSQQIVDQLEAFVGQRRDGRQAEVDQRQFRTQLRIAQEGDGGCTRIADVNGKIGLKREVQALGDHRIVIDDQQNGLR
jgi:hypothetical protein